MGKCACGCGAGGGWMNGTMKCFYLAPTPFNIICIALLHAMLLLIWFWSIGPIFRYWMFLANFMLLWFFFWNLDAKPFRR
jgi:hypothetical protein